MGYEKQTWIDGVSPLNAERLNHMEEGIFAAQTGGNVATPNMYGAVGDGVTDDTAAINACLAENSYVHFPAGTYLIDAAIGVKPKSNQTIQFDKNATLKGHTETTSVDGVNITSWAMVQITAVENVVLSGGNIVGDKVEYEDTLSDHRHGIRVRNSKNITVDGCKIYGHRGDGIMVATSGNEADYARVVVQNVKVVDCEIYDCVRHGMSVDGVDGLTIKNVEIHDCTAREYSCSIDFEIEYGYHAMHNITLDGLKSYNTKLGVQISEINAGSYANFKFDNSDVERFVHSFGNDLTINNNRIGSLICSSPNELNVYGSTITGLNFIGAGKSCFYNCHFESKNRNIMGFTEKSAEDTEVTFDKCTFVTYKFAEGEQKYVPNAMMSATGTDTSPKALHFFSCNIYINNPNNMGGLGNTSDFRMCDCYVKVTYNFDGHGNNFFDLPKNAVIINSVFDTTDAEWAQSSAFLLVMGNTESAKLINNIVEGKRFIYPFYKKTAGKVECINNVLRDYTEESINSGIDSTVATFINIGTITSNTTA
jgi:hypothetical protein